MTSIHKNKHCYFYFALFKSVRFYQSPCHKKSGEHWRNDAETIGPDDPCFDASPR